MKRFTFELERVLKLKQRREWLAEIQQQNAAAAVNAAQTEADNIRQEINKACSHLQEKLGKAQDATSWVAVYHQSARLQQALQSANHKVERAKSELERAAALRKQAAIEVEVLLALRQRKWQEHRGDMQRAAQEELDDVGMRRWSAARVAKTDENGLEGAQA